MLSKGVISLFFSSIKAKIPNSVNPEGHKLTQVSWTLFPQGSQIFPELTKEDK